MKKIIKSILLLAAITTGMVSFVSCSDDDDLTTADALFRPIISESDNIVQGLDENLVPYVIVKWDNYTSANQYTVKMEATDGSDVKEITTSDLTCQFNGLQYDKEYYVYISSSNTNTGLSSKPYSVTITTIDYPTNLNSVAATDIIDNAARIRWSENGDYDLLKVIKDSNDSLVNEVTVTSDMKAVRAAIVDGLQPRTTYRVEAYKDNVYKGKKRFTTAAAENFSGAVIDLRAVVDSVGKTYITTEQLAADVAEYAGQDLTYVLKGGFDYKVSGGTALPATANKIKFVTGLTLAGNARFIQSGGFTMTSGAEINDVVFEKIDFVSDKVNNGSFNGDPSSALLEVLDPEQNSAFHDNYLDLDYDLSKVMFIATANDVQSIPAPLLDRMELIELSGYTTEEKIEIAQRHLVKKEKEANGLSDNKELKISKAAMEYLIENYTRESGVRGLEKAIGSLMRKCAVKLASDEKIGKIEKQDVTEMLGKPKYTKEIYQGNELPGVVTGLAWTSVGGVILFIETSISKGKEGKLTLSGNLGDVMKESAGLALSYIRAHADELGLSEEIFETHNIHIHVPEGAVPKDGPSAGITMATSLASALTGRRVRKNLAMTGEITLRGRVLPVGGIREKILAAKRAGIKEIILCKENEKDILEIPQDYLKGLSFHYVETVSDVLDYALLK